MPRSWPFAILSVLAVLACPAMGQIPGSDVDVRPDPAVACHVGLYRLDDGSWIDVAPRVASGLQWLRPDGSRARLGLDADGHWTSTSGSTDRAEGPQPQLGRCDEARIAYAGQAGARIALLSQDTTFVGGGGTRLRGRLILPPGDEPVPIMVEVHGSEGASALDFNVFQRFAPASGVGVFVYAKRGSGGSEGRYTQDFHVLAADAAAAVVEARRLAGGRAGRVGLHGGSQAGWVAPLAAARTAVDFVIIDYGLAYGPLQQESDLVARHLAEKGWNAEVLEQATDITDAVGAFVVSNGAVGFHALDAVRETYRHQPWFQDVQGDFTAMVLNATPDQLRVMIPAFDVGTSWTYDPLPVLSTLDTPMLWILAEADSRAPPEASRARLIDLSADGRPITVLQYPGTDHGLVRFETDPAGRRVALGYAPGYFTAVLDWAKTGRLAGDYGDGRLLARPAEADLIPASPR